MPSRPDFVFPSKEIDPKELDEEIKLHGLLTRPTLYTQKGLSYRNPISLRATTTRWISFVPS